MINYFFKFKLVLILIDVNKIFPMKPSEFEISLLVESYDKKNALKIAEIATLLKNT